MINKLPIIILVTIAIVFGYLVYLHKDFTSDEAAYVTSDECRDCHTLNYDSWKKNTLHPYMFLPVESPDARILGDFNSKNHPMTDR